MSKENMSIDEWRNELEQAIQTLTDSEVLEFLEWIKGGMKD